MCTNININRLISQIIFSNLGRWKFFLKVIHCVLICDCFFWSYHFPDWIKTITLIMIKSHCTTVHIHTHSLGDANFGFSLDFCQLGFPHRILLQTRNISGKVEILDISNIFLTRVYWKFNLKVLPAEQLVPNMKVEYVPGHWQHFPESSIDNLIFRFVLVFTLYLARGVIAFCPSPWSLEICLLLWSPAAWAAWGLCKGDCPTQQSLENWNIVVLIKPDIKFHN